MIRSEVVGKHFVIESRLRRTPNDYVLRDLSGETLQGVFNEEQLQMVRAADVFPISRIVRKSGKRALVECASLDLKSSTVGSLEVIYKKSMKDCYVYLPNNTDFLHENKA